MTEGTLWVYADAWGDQTIMMLTHVATDGWLTFTHFDARMGKDYIHVSNVYLRGFKPLTAEKQ